jgi:2-hydroxy-6-oxonona-2,4-dienedioate hydrolase
MIQYPLAANGTMTRVIAAGTTGDAIIFMHGLGARADRWRRNLDAIAATGYRCIAFDWPGHGLAQKGAVFRYTVPGFSAFLEALLDTLQLRQVILVGTSLGGHVAAHFACRHPERVIRMVLVGATGLLPIGRDVGEKIRASVREVSLEQIAAKLRFVMIAPGAVTSELIEEEYRIANSPGAASALERLGAYIADGVDRDCVGEQLAALPTRPPIMLVWGAEDRVVPLAIGERARELLRLSSMTIISGAGHAPYFERPDVFNPAVLEFLGA